MSAYLDRPLRTLEEVSRALRVREAACGNCNLWEPPTYFPDGRVGDPFGYCPVKRSAREAADVACYMHERAPAPADEEHGDVGAAR